MKTNILPLLPDSFYHVYNRGINGENVFKEERNYPYFLRKMAMYLPPVVDIYAYCLLKNHFHLLIRTRSEADIQKVMPATSRSVNGPHQERSVSWIISNAFASLFKSYAQSINKAHKRTGRLFEEPFRRIWVGTDAYFRELIYYIHHNPQRHGFVADFRTYAHSSYLPLLHDAPTRLKRAEVMDWFGGVDPFVAFHSREQRRIHPEPFVIEI